MPRSSGASRRSIVDEPTPEEALQILEGLKPRYEQHHKLGISQEALETAVRLSERYIQDRSLPDKAIDLMDEAAAKVRLRTAVEQADSPCAQDQAPEARRRHGLAESRLRGRGAVQGRPSAARGRAPGRARRRPKAGADARS